jgi:hypothetical protein
MTYTRMDPDKRDALVAALRSGEFPQGRERLRTEGGFCCLGVACEVYRLNTGKGAWTDDADGYIVFATDPDFSAMWLPDGVAEYYGIARDGGFPLIDDDGERREVYRRFRREFPELSSLIFSDGQPPSLVSMNDHGTPFAEIARAIELFW